MADNLLCKCYAGKILVLASSVTCACLADAENRRGDQVDLIKTANEGFPLFS